MNISGSFLDFCKALGKDLKVELFYHELLTEFHFASDGTMMMPLTLLFTIWKVLYPPDIANCVFSFTGEE